MNLSSMQLIAKGGEIYCQIFENPSQGIARNLFWSVIIDFKPIEIDGDSCDCAAACDWLRWPIRRWTELDGCEANFSYGEMGFESSFYLYEHHPADRTRIAFVRKTRNEFEVSLSMELHIPDDIGVDVKNPLLIQADIPLPFTGLLLVPENLDLQSPSDELLANVASPFLDLTSFDGPERYAHGFRFPPK